MKIQNYKKGKQQKVFEILDIQGYILDDQSAKIFGNDGLYKVYEHIRIWKKLQSDREFFKDKKILSVKKGYRSHLAEITPERYYKIGKEFYNECLANLTS